MIVLQRKIRPKRPGSSGTSASAYVRMRWPSAGSGHGSNGVTWGSGSMYDVGVAAPRHHVLGAGGEDPHHDPGRPDLDLAVPGRHDRHGAALHRRPITSRRDDGRRVLRGEEDDVLVGLPGPPKRWPAAASE